MKRFTYDSLNERIIDHITDSAYYSFESICELLNQESDKCDKVIESFMTEELMNLRWQKDIHERYNNEVNNILEKYNIGSLKKLDRILFENKVM